MSKNEIDLSEFFNSIWINKSKIILITFVTVIISVISKLNEKIPQTVFIATTEIMPISTFDDYEYSSFNTFIMNQESPGMNSYYLKELGNKDVSLTINFQDNSIPKNKYLRQIDKKYLFELFIEKINQNELFIKGIKKFNIIKQEDFQNTKDFEDAVVKLASSVKIFTQSDSENTQYIEFETISKKTWEELLYFVESSANYEIKEYLKNNFRLFISSIKRLNRYSIEDIELQISNNIEDEVIVSKLNKIKKSKEDSRIIERLEYLFNSTPIVKSDNFSASKFNVQLTKYKKKKNGNYYSIKKVVIFSIILGILLGITYVVVATKLISRKNRDIIN